MRKAVTTILLLTALLFGFNACEGPFMDPGVMEVMDINGTGGGGGLGGIGGGDNETGGNSTSRTYNGYDGGGNAYKLVITKGSSNSYADRAAYAVQTGDDYKLTINKKVSEGTVTSYSGTLTLKQYNAVSTFDVTVSGNNLTEISGTVTFNDGQSHNFGYNFVLYPPGGDGLTIVDLPAEYNGKGIYFVGYGENINDSISMLLGIKSISNNGTYSLSAISNGRVTIPLYFGGTVTQSGYKKYTGTGTFEVICLIINTTTVNPEDFYSYMTSGNLGLVTFEEVTFTNGKAQVGWNQNDTVWDFGREWWYW